MDEVHIEVQLPAAHISQWKDFISSLTSESPGASSHFLTIKSCAFTPLGEFIQASIDFHQSGVMMLDWLETESAHSVSLPEMMRLIQELLRCCAAAVAVQPELRISPKMVYLVTGMQVRIAPFEGNRDEERDIRSILKRIAELTGSEDVIGIVETLIKFLDKPDAYQILYELSLRTRLRTEPIRRYSKRHPETMYCPVCHNPLPSDPELLPRDAPECCSNACYENAEPGEILADPEAPTCLTCGQQSTRPIAIYQCMTHCVCRHQCVPVYAQNEDMRLLLSHICPVCMRFETKIDFNGSHRSLFERIETQKQKIVNGEMDDFIELRVMFDTYVNLCAHDLEESASWPLCIQAREVVSTGLLLRCCVCSRNILVPKWPPQIAHLWPEAPFLLQCQWKTHGVCSQACLSQISRICPVCPNSKIATKERSTLDIIRRIPTIGCRHNTGAYDTQPYLSCSHEFCVNCLLREIDSPVVTTFTCPVCYTTCTGPQETRETAGLSADGDFAGRSKQATPSKVAVDVASFEELATLASRFYERDHKTTESLDRCHRLCHSFHPDQLKRLRDKLHLLKRDLDDVKTHLGKDCQGMHKVTRRVTMVVQEFRIRCRETYTEYLKGLDLDIRKILKPLVPSKVLDEQIRYRKINSNPSILSSLQSTIKSELKEGHEASEIEESGEFDPQTDTRDQVAKLNAHIELLVNTLETVAKELIGLCGDVNRRYYEVVNPAELISGPPTPLAAPLPEYFSFNAADPIEDQLELMNIVDPTVISESQRQILIQKLMKLNHEGHLSEHLLQPEKVEKLRIKLAGVGKREIDIRELNLEEIFRDETVVPVSEREKLVYSLINSERSQSKDVTLDDIINATQDSQDESVRLIEHPREHRKRRMSAKKKPEVEDSGLPPPVDKYCEPGNKSEILPLPPPLVDNSFEQAHGTPLISAQRARPIDFYTPPADALRTPQSFFEQHRKSLPPITKLDKKASHGRSVHGMKVNSVAKLTRDERSSRDVRVRSVTPVPSKQQREEKKMPSPVKKPVKSPVPGVRRGKAAGPKKHSLS